MKCVIPGINVKLLAKAIHALSKVGDEMYVQPQENSISFRTVNDSNSAFADFTFNENFFSYYSFGDLDKDDALKCKISMRSAFAVFKTPNTLEKQVETCHIKLKPNASTLLFILKYKNTVTKTHLLPIIDCEILRAAYVKDGVPNQLSCQAKVFVEAVHNFQQNLVEVTLEVTPQKVLLRNYVEDATGMSNVTRTQLALGRGEFDDYQVGEETTITFCMKELKAVLAFSESVNLPVRLNFETPGRPLVFIMQSSILEANLVLSTLNPDVDGQSESTDRRPETKVTKKRSKQNSRAKQPPKRTVKMINQEKLFNDKPNESSTLKTVDDNQMILESVNTTNDSNKLVENIFHVHQDREKESEDAVPNSPPPRPSPPSKVVKTMFKKCFSSTFNANNLPGHEIILVEDSGDED